MAYASWSVVFGEQPSAAKWNILGTNDASFNDGTGIAANAIVAAALSTTAITIGYAEATTSQGSITTEADLTSLSVAVTVPSGSRRLQILAQVSSQSSVADSVSAIRIKEGAATLNLGYITHGLANAPHTGHVEYSATGISAGAHTYKLSLARNSGTGTLTAVSGSSTQTNFILVKVI